MRGGRSLRRWYGRSSARREGRGARSHHPTPMQIADVLHGVTMQERGLSKRVAVKFDQGDSQGRIAEHAAA